MTGALDKHVVDLGREYPDWKPWLAVVEEVLKETADEKWERFVPERPAIQAGKMPLLAGVTLELEKNIVGRWLQRLLRAAYQNDAPKMSSLKIAKQTRLPNAALFQSSLCQNGDQLRRIAIDLGVDADAFQAVAILVSVPFLQACNRRWASSKSESWMEGYCFVCGAWPAFAEVRGIERSRHFRCGRCGGEWEIHCLVCPYCGMTDHEQLVSLVPETSGSTSVVDACKRCRGYVKSFTTLQGSPPAKVMVDDLASVALDLAALEQGYKRPEGPGYSFRVTVMEKSGLSDWIFPWGA